jgi:hypothetical protein
MSGLALLLALIACATYAVMRTGARAPNPACASGRTTTFWLATALSKLLADAGFTAARLRKAVALYRAGTLALGATLGYAVVLVIHGM